jgi:hypothetical protein
MIPRFWLLVPFLSAAVFGQASFDLQSPACGYAFPTPCWVGDPEGVSFNGVVTWGSPAFGATVSPANGLGMPTAGSQFLRLQCANANIGTNVPAGGPIPASGSFARLWIPIPPLATSVSFNWDFYTGDYVGSFYNDAVAVDVVDGCGGSASVLSNLIYADMHSPGLTPVVDSGPCGIQDFIPASGVRELAAPTGNAGPQLAVAALPAGAAFLRVTAANGFDNAVTGQIVIDSVTFVGSGGSLCATSFTSPAGPGSVLMVNTACAASIGRDFFTAVDLTAGTYPGGLFFGLDMTIPELLSQFTAGYPFSGVLDGAGGSSSGVVGPAPGLTGLTLFAVTTEWTPGYGALMQVRPKATYVIP